MADKPLWLTEADVRELGSLEAAIEILARAYGPESQAGAQNMQRAHARHGETILHAVGGMLTGQGVAGTKSWIYSPAGASPLLVVFSIEDGRLLGLVEAFTLGLWRTAATTGLGTKLLAREDAHILTQLGTGKQALSQAQAVASVRDLRELRIFGRDRTRLDDFADRASEVIDADVSTHTDLGVALAGADIVTTITRAADPFLPAELLAGGMHVNAVGAIVPSRSELTADAVGACDIVVSDSPAQARADSGELRAAAEAGLLDWSKVTSLAELVVDPRLGRSAAAEITLFKALGVGLSDVALGAELLHRAQTAGLGTPLPATRNPHGLNRPPTRSQTHA